VPVIATDIRELLDVGATSACNAAARAMQDIFNDEDGDHARVAAKAFQIDYGTKFPEAAAKITDDLDVLLEFYARR